jgi:hypothetical protein
MARTRVVRHKGEPLALLELRLGPRADLAHHRHEVDVHAWLGLGSGCRVWGVGCGVWGVGCGVWGVGCGVLGCGVWGVGCGGWGVGLEVGVHTEHADEPLCLTRRATLRRA